MVAVRKFLFDVSFDVLEEPEEDVEQEAEEAEPEEEVPSFSEEEMNAAREEAFAAGKEEGVSEAAAATERDILAALTAFGGQFGGLFEAQEKANASILENAITAAVAITRKVFPALNERNALGEVERMVIETLDTILEEPRVTVYVNSELAEPLSERLSARAAEAKYKGEVQVVASEDIAPGDCRVEWSGGGAKRDMAELWREIDEIVERNLSAESPQAPVDGAAGPEATDAAGETPQPEDPSADAGGGIGAEAGQERTPAPDAASEPPAGQAPGAGDSAESADSGSLQPDVPPAAPETADDPEGGAGEGGAESEPGEDKAPEDVEPGIEEAILDQGADDTAEPPAEDPAGAAGDGTDEPKENAPEPPGAEDTTTDQEDS